jgi:hypothetical protein
MKMFEINGEKCCTSDELSAPLLEMACKQIKARPVATLCPEGKFLYRVSDLFKACEWLRQQGQIAGRYVDFHKAIDDHIDRENVEVEKEVNAEQEAYTWVKPDACKVTATLERYQVAPEPPKTRKRGKPGYAEMPVKRAIITLQVKNRILAKDSPPILASDIHDYLRQVKSIAIPISTIKGTNAYKAYRKSLKEKK